MEVFLGISAVDGTGIGSAFIIPETIKRVIPQNQITKDEISEGWTRFKNAISSVKQEILLQLANLSTENKADSVQKEILDTYLLMLDDPVFLQEVQTEYEEKLFNIEYTINTKAEEYASRLRNIGNEYLAERAQDITDVFGKVLNKMLGIIPFDINQVPDGSVIIATSLSPTDTIILSKKKMDTEKRSFARPLPIFFLPVLPVEEKKVSAYPLRHFSGRTGKKKHVRDFWTAYL